MKPGIFDEKGPEQRIKMELITGRRRKLEVHVIMAKTQGKKKRNTTFGGKDAQKIAVSEKEPHKTEKGNQKEYHGSVKSKRETC